MGKLWNQHIGNTTPNYGRDPKINSKEVDAAEESWDKAMRAGDWKALERLFADDFIDTTADGVVITRDGYMDALKNHPPRIKSLSVDARKVPLFVLIRVPKMLSAQPTRISLCLCGLSRFLRD